jgi:hypothetical protein
LGDAVSAVAAASVALSQSGTRDRKVKDALDRVERAVGLPLRVGNSASFIYTAAE